VASSRPTTRGSHGGCGYKPGDFLVTDEVFARALPLPMYEGLTPGDQERVVELLSRNLV
jgi:dTDP-4-amino-4,6-dideoxygalactose transaminase